MSEKRRKILNKLADARPGTGLVSRSAIGEKRRAFTEVHICIYCIYKDISKDPTYRYKKIYFA